MNYTYYIGLIDSEKSDREVGGNGFVGERTNKTKDERRNKKIIERTGKEELKERENGGLERDETEKRAEKLKRRSRKREDNRLRIDRK